MQYAFVLDKNRKPLMPCHPARARKLLKKGRAAVFRLAPFTIILKDRTLEESDVQSVALKIAPSAKETGIAAVREDDDGKQHALALLQLKHRSERIRDALTARRNLRRSRRSRKLRYRAKRFSNRKRAEGWLAPSLRHRVETTVNWVGRLRKLVPVTRIVYVLNKFDTQKMQTPDIEGIGYQHGELFEYEVREYLFEKFGRKCVYCGKSDVSLNIDHVVPRARGGSNRLSNLVLACVECNQTKGARTQEDFLHGKPATLKRIKEQLKRPLKTEAELNATRWAMYRELKATGLLVEVGSVAQTKFNRHVFNVPKAPCLDALCAGKINGLSDWQKRDVLNIACTGRGSYQRTRVNKYGFPRGYLMRTKRIKGYATGDLVRAVVPSGKKAGAYTGRVSVRARGYFNIKTSVGIATDIASHYCRLLQRSDGYGYEVNHIQ